ncbi:hypothetical protein M8312_05910 [Sphingomonas sp. KRR8]|uniref:hypothetical protein n=1 Tax=Sphingomonas sp. KRR8 TaxID=2942996 RepID=UPI00202109ED|nr:hypothetical protein [Sphingomonas sp. KRR8]URD62040.1 hypothetical protein M8312_05910 [Sphingomonas sp. KRR8]
MVVTFLGAAFLADAFEGIGIVMPGMFMCCACAAAGVSAKALTATSKLILTVHLQTGATRLRAAPALVSQLADCVALVLLGHVFAAILAAVLGGCGTMLCMLCVHARHRMRGS